MDEQDQIIHIAHTAVSILVAEMQGDRAAVLDLLYGLDKLEAQGVASTFLGALVSVLQSLDMPPETVAELARSAIARATGT